MSRTETTTETKNGTESQPEAMNGAKIANGGGHDPEKSSGTIAAEEWKPQKQERFIMYSLSFLSLMVALDSTILVTALPVGHSC